jgi:hypothetical protein
MARIPHGFTDDIVFRKSQQRTQGVSCRLEKSFEVDSATGGTRWGECEGPIGKWSACLFFSGRRGQLCAIPGRPVGRVGCAGCVLGRAEPSWLSLPGDAAQGSWMLRDDTLRQRKGRDGNGKMRYPASPLVEPAALPKDLARVSLRTGEEAQGRRTSHWSDKACIFSLPLASTCRRARRDL